MSSSPKESSSSTTASLKASKPLNSNLLYRTSTLLAIKILGCIRPREGGVLMLTDKLCVKYGRRVHLSEASTMQFISQHTSLPVPKVFCAFTHSGRTYIVMERIKGDIVGHGWIGRSEDSKKKLLSQLAAMVRELQNLPPPEGMGVASVDGDSIFDCRISGPSLRHGPFSTIQDFHRHLRSGTGFDSKLPSEVQELIKQQDQGTWPLVFTHGDLSSLNILARGDDIVAQVVLLIGRLPAGIHPTGNIPLPNKSTHKILFGFMRSTSFCNQCQKNWRWSGLDRNTLETFNDVAVQML